MLSAAALDALVHYRIKRVTILNRAARALSRGQSEIKRVFPWLKVAVAHVRIRRRRRISLAETSCCPTQVALEEAPRKRATFRSARLDLARSQSRIRVRAR